MIDRREAIRRVTALLGGGAVVGGSSLVAACERAQRGVAAAGAGAGTFSAQDVALLDEVVETILPETKTPGAKAAHVGAFMALMVSDTYEDREQQIFRAGMRQLEQAGFMAAKPAERMALMVSDTYEDREQQIFRAGMRQLEQAGFMAGKPRGRGGAAAGRRPRARHAPPEAGRVDAGQAGGAAGAARAARPRAEGVHGRQSGRRAGALLPPDERAHPARLLHLGD